MVDNKVYVSLTEEEIQVLAKVGKAAKVLKKGGLSLTREDIEKTNLAEKHLLPYLSAVGKLTKQSN